MRTHPGQDNNQHDNNHQHDKNIQTKNNPTENNSHSRHRNPERNQASDYHQPQTAEELTRQNVETIARMEEAAQAKRTPTDCVVDAITGFCGRITFVWLHVAWFTLWIGLNTLHHHHHFDPYPFNFLTFTVSLEAILLSTFILISQNRQARLSERRSHLDLQVNLLSEQENTKMLAMLESIVKHLNIPDGDPEVSILQEATQPDRLVEQIQKVIEKEPSSDGAKSNDG